MIIMKILLVLLGLIVVALIIKSFVPSNKNTSYNASRPKRSPMPPKSDNDKIVIVRGAPYTDIKKAVKQFCDIYNKDDYSLIASLTKISDRDIVITFPYDLTFDMFCFFVNYMYYPNGINYKADIKAWATTKPGDVWIAPNLAGKKVMLYIPPEDKEYDNVYLVSNENIHYKLGFAVGEETQPLSGSGEKYIEQTVQIEEIKNKAAEIIQ
ncbi:hypothetical protein DDR33_15770 [Pararcticibacter amylolyticus]|uniref:Uncharacterized protein n=2 Tax=Pararcticibacter amylolyticus TaxID=2173175 RepID=A0A2U2PEI0_9SPHI|nr:hypothetical protein DDR33_15770 [Pararcticibacter amylolyticus]